ncbi:hypothetical protein BV20DRAFT_918586, partial [Pilatotrama ljubarskyi]
GVRADMPVWDDDTTRWFWEFLPITEVIGIACTASRYLYHRRPKAKQYEWLKMVLGEPTWFRW